MVLLRAAPRRGCGSVGASARTPNRDPFGPSSAGAGVVVGSRWAVGVHATVRLDLDAVFGRLHVLPARRLRRALRVCLLSGVRLDVAGRAVGVGLRTVALLRRVRSGAVRVVQSRVLALPGTMALRAVPRWPLWGQACARLCGPRRSWRRETSAVPRRCRISRRPEAGLHRGGAGYHGGPKPGSHRGDVGYHGGPKPGSHRGGAGYHGGPKPGSHRGGSAFAGGGRGGGSAGPVPAPRSGAAGLRLAGAVAPVAPVAAWDAATVGRGRRHSSARSGLANR